METDEGERPSFGTNELGFEKPRLADAYGTKERRCSFKVRLFDPGMRKKYDGEVIHSVLHVGVTMLHCAYIPSQRRS
jgi:hypothetical protein